MNTIETTRKWVGGPGVEEVAPRIDELLRAAIAEKRLIQFHYQDKPRIVEPHDYGIHQGSIKLFGFQVAGLSSHPLPNWRWALVNSISDLDLLNRRFPGRRPAPSGNIIGGIGSSPASSRPKRKAITKPQPSDAAAVHPAW